MRVSGMMERKRFTFPSTGDRVVNMAIHKKSKEEKKMADTEVNDIFTKMPDVFNADAAQGLDAVFQFEITGEGGGNWNVAVKDGACEVSEGVNETPTVTLNMSAETWIGMINKEVNGMQAFMSGQLKATGDIMLAQRIEQLFPL